GLVFFRSYPRIDALVVCAKSVLDVKTERFHSAIHSTASKAGAAQLVFRQSNADRAGVGVEEPLQDCLRLIDLALALFLVCAASLGHLGHELISVIGRLAAPANSAHLFAGGLECKAQAGLDRAQVILDH